VGEWPVKEGGEEYVKLLKKREIWECESKRTIKEK
jgi:hypothetical protein